MDQNMLPPDYQAELEAAQRKRQMAQMLMQRGMNFQPAQSQGRIASRTPLIAALANLGVGYMGSDLDRQATEGANLVRRRFNNDQTQAVEAFQNLPPEQAIKTGQTSQFPMVQSLAKAMQDREAKRLEMAVKAISEGKDTEGAISVLNNPSLLSGYKKPSVKPAEFGTTPTGKGYVRDYNPDGSYTTRLEPSPAVQNNVPGAEKAIALGDLKTDLGARRTRADAAKEVIGFNTQMIDALEQGAKAGGGETIKQFIRRVLQAAGTTLPETASTTQLQMAAGGAILANAAKIRPASDTDMKILAKIVGDIETDPTALTRAIAHAQAMSLRELSDFNRYVGAQSENLTDPVMKSVFQNQHIGYELPGRLSGPMPFQMETLRALQNIGGDLSQFEGVDETGKPFKFSPNAKFNINPTAAFPGVADRIPEPTKPGTPQKPLRVDQLTPAQKEELRKLLGG